MLSEWNLQGVRPAGASSPLRRAVGDAERRNGTQGGGAPPGFVALGPCKSHGRRRKEDKAPTPPWLAVASLRLPAGKKAPSSGIVIVSFLAERADDEGTLSRDLLPSLVQNGTAIRRWFELKMSERRFPDLC